LKSKRSKGIGGGSGKSKLAREGRCCQTRRINGTSVLKGQKSRARDKSLMRISKEIEMDLVKGTRDNVLITSNR